MFSRVSLMTSFMVVMLISGGCSQILKSSIDTQPRVMVSAAQLADPASIVGGDPTVYLMGEDAEGLSDPDLLRLAPIIIQGFQPVTADLEYDYTSDALGSPILASNGKEVRIDTTHPIVYSRVEYAHVGDIELKQLVYAFWYPERPVGALQTGNVDGGVLRITLDGNGYPVIFEYSQPCGCFHGVFVSRGLELEAEREYSEIAPQRYYAVEPPLTGETDWVVRDLIDVIPDARPTLYMSAGKHFCEAIAFTCAAEHSSLVVNEYELAPYGSLEAIPQDGGGEGSMFNSDGLVLGGKRWKEEVLLADLKNPGWPRRLDQMLIHWDQDQWTDPKLLENRLRLPAAILTGLKQAVTSARMLPGPAPLVSQSNHPAVERALFFTNRYCIGCEFVRIKLLPHPDVQRALVGTEYEVIDTATPQGSALAGRYHVSLTPVLVIVDETGAEIRRTEDIDTPEKVIAAVHSE